MRNLIETTTGNLSKEMVLSHCGDYAGSFQDKAYEIFQEIWNDEINAWDGHIWMDIMYDQNGNVYAVWAEDSLTCQDAWCYYIKLDMEDCPNAFEGMVKKLTNK